MDRRTLWKGYFYILTSAVVYGTMPLMAKLIYAQGVDAMSLVFWRNLLAIPVLAFLATRKGGSLKLPIKDLGFVAVSSVFGSCITPVLLFSSYSFVASGTATVFHFIYPSVVVLWGFLFGRGEKKWTDLLCAGICAAGIILFYDPAEPLDLRGAGLALLSGVTYAVYILLVGSSGHRKIPPMTFSFYILCFCAAAMLLVCTIRGGVRTPESLTGWLLCLAFSVGINVGAVMLFQLGTMLIGSQRAAILSTMEPITSILIGALVFAESIGPGTAAGSVLVVMSTILIAVFDRKRH